MNIQEDFEFFTIAAPLVMDEAKDVRDVKHFLLTMMAWQLRFDQLQDRMTAIEPDIPTEAADNVHQKIDAIRNTLDDLILTAERRIAEMENES